VAPYLRRPSGRQLGISDPGDERRPGLTCVAADVLD
jgi:hypothetical protein